MKIGFDNQKYLTMQSEHIRERINHFGNKLYLEFGGKLFDDYHASRVLPGFAPDSKLQMLLQLSSQAEIVIVINAADIEKNKIRHDLGITYDLDVLRLIQVYRDKGLYVGSVVITRYTGQATADQFKTKLEHLGIKVYRHYPIEGYPNNIAHIVSDEGYGKNDYIETTRPLVIVTAPGPGSGKMATCLSQLYHENKRGVKAGYAKFETFPIWNIPLKHPVNLAYEAATADLNDLNMIDPFHLEAYGKTTVNYNRDVEIYPVLAAMFEEIFGECPYKSPTDMGVNMAGNCIVDDEVCQEASRQEIIRRYYQSMNRLANDEATKEEVYKCELLMKQAKVTTNNRVVVPAANQLAALTGAPAAALELPDGTIVTGKTGSLLGPSSAVLLNAVKTLAGIEDSIHLISPTFIEPIQELKTKYLGSKNPRLHTDEVLIALSTCAATDEHAKKALEQLPKLNGLQIHTSVMLSDVDINTFKKLGLQLTSEPVREQ
ncbi:ATP-dependent Zn protease [Lachnospiraceae bacterium TWA4]|nr:ATP-dependent Zn protease [Lachnospiraceae bacterium TWA4]